MVTQSAQLVAARVLNPGATTVYVADVNLVVLVKSAFIRNLTAADQYLELFVRDPRLPVAMQLIGEDVVANQTASWEGWVVLKAGDELQVSIQTAPIGVWVSGTHLPAPP